jgi:hypothetical protein
MEKLFDLPNARVSDCAGTTGGWPKRAAFMDCRIGGASIHARQAQPKFPHTRLGWVAPLRSKPLGNSWTVIQECYKFVILWAGVPWDA